MSDNNQQPRIIAFTKDWSDVPTCTTHILREMAKKLPVLWVSSIGTRRPSLGSGRDLGRIFARLKRVFLRAEHKENRLRVLSPLLIPRAGSGWAQWLNRKLFAWYVKREADWMGSGPIEYWCFVPNAVDLLPKGLSSRFGVPGSEFPATGRLEGGGPPPDKEPESEKNAQCSMLNVQCSMHNDEPRTKNQAQNFEPRRHGGTESPRIARMGTNENQEPRTKNKEPGTRNSERAKDGNVQCSMFNVQCSTGNEAPRTKNQEPGTRNSAVRRTEADQLDRQRSGKPGTPNPEPGTRIIYYCVDDWTKFSNIDGAWMGRKERELLGRADVVFATSLFLVRKCDGIRRRGDVVYVPHGVEYEKFAVAVGSPRMGTNESKGPGARNVEPRRHGGTESPRIERMDTNENDEPRTKNYERGTRNSEPGTVIGFYGNISDWVDLELIARLAAARPSWRFLIIGPHTVEEKELPHRDNIEYPGRVEHDELPRWCAGFDAAMIPYKVDDPRMESVNPVKAKELLAAGVPVVASRVPELEGIAPDVLIADTLEEWLDCLEKQIERKDREAISEKMKSEDWQTKIQEIRRQGINR